MLDCKYTLLGGNARPDPPCVPPAKFWPYSASTAWRSELGDRVLTAVAPSAGKEECGGFVAAEQGCWCRRAMGGGGSAGFSFSRNERDSWSERMVSEFGLEATFYNCFLREHDLALEHPYQVERTCLGPREVNVEGRDFDTLGSLLRDRPPLSCHLRVDTELTGWAVLEQLLGEPEVLAKVRTLDLRVIIGGRSIAETQNICLNQTKNN